MNNNPLKLFNYSRDKLYYSTEYNCDLKGNIIIAETRDSYYKQLSYNKYNFDTFGRITEYIITSALGKSDTFTVNYLGNGNVLKIIYQSTQNKKPQIEIRKYNNKGKIIESSYNDEIKSLYNYNSKAECVNIFTTKTFSEIGLKQNIRTSFTYYPNSLVQSKTYRIDNGDPILYKVYYWYH